MTVKIAKLLPYSLMLVACWAMTSAIPCVDWAPKTLTGSRLTSKANLSLIDCYEFCMDYHECNVAMWDPEELDCKLVSTSSKADIYDLLNYNDDVAIVHLHCPEALSTRSACKDSGLSLDLGFNRTYSGLLSEGMCEEVCVDDCVAAVYNKMDGECRVYNDITDKLAHVDPNKDILYRHCHCGPVMDMVESVELVRSLRVECSDTSLKEGTACLLNCDEGAIPLGRRRLTCIHTANNSMEWDLDSEMLKCVAPVAVLLGGVDEQGGYTDEVEVVQPEGLTCHSSDLNETTDLDKIFEAKLPSMPLRLTGSVSGWLHNSLMVCGGAQQSFTDCQWTRHGGKLCDRIHDKVNLTSHSASSWLITGPKSKECFVFMENEWQSVVQLVEARAFAQAVVVDIDFDEKLVIVGGVGNERILDSVEIVFWDHRKHVWAVQQATPLPRAVFGHCLVSLDDVLLSMGGWGVDAIETELFVYTWSTDTWTTDKGPNRLRVDPVCAVVDNDVVVVLGGWNDHHRSISSIEIRESAMSGWSELEYNATSWSWARRSASMALFNSRLFVLGGVICDHMKCVRSEEIDALEVTSSTEWTSESSRVNIKPIDSNFNAVKGRSSSTMAIGSQTIMCN